MMLLTQHMDIDNKKVYFALAFFLTTFANTSDISTVDTFVDELGDDIKSLGADKAYKSKAIDKLLEEKDIENSICLKETNKMSDEDRKNQRENEKPKYKIRAPGAIDLMSIELERNQKLNTHLL